MFGRGFKIFTLFGIPVYLDISFFLIVPLFAYLIGQSLPVYAQWTGVQAAAFELFQITPVDARGNPVDVGQVRAAAYNVGRPWAAIAFGAAMTLGLYLSVLVHEFGHALTARAYGVRTERVTLWFLGGVAGFERMPRQPGAEAVVAIVGPLVSFAVAGLLWMISGITSQEATAWQLVIQSLSIVNLVLATFNLLPALPLDGGRVLRSLLALAMPYRQATGVSAIISKSLAFLLGIVALVGGNLMLVAIAIFIWFAVNAETRQTAVESLLKGLRVGDLMVRDVEVVRPDTSAGALLQAMLQRRHLGFPVVEEDGRVVGVVGLRELQDGFDPNTPVAALMNRNFCTQSPTALAQDAFDSMSSSGFARCIVVDPYGRLLGLLTKGDLMRHIQIRAAADGPLSNFGVTSRTTASPT